MRQYPNTQYINILSFLIVDQRAFSLTNQSFNVRSYLPPKNNNLNQIFGCLV